MSQPSHIAKIINLKTNDMQQSHNKYKNTENQLEWDQDDSEEFLDKTSHHSELPSIIEPHHTDMQQDKLYPLFNAMDETDTGSITKQQLYALFKKRGIPSHDRRIHDIILGLDQFSWQEKISFNQFKQLIYAHSAFIERLLIGDLIIPEFDDFSDSIKDIYNKVKHNHNGDVAQYIPQLARIDPEQFAISILTIDGQHFSIGDAETRYCVQSTCKPINYCIALELNGEDKVHSHIGREPSGRVFNELALNRKNLPHNPLINAGAIMSCAMIKPEEMLADRFDYIMEVWQKLIGGKRPNYNNSVYHSEKATADRNFALAHFMREMKAFPENTNIYDTLDFYFQCCSIEVTAIDMAMIAATFANSGISPVTRKKVFSANTVKNCLSLMYSCGMYDFSGEFAFTTGLPAKSGVSGALMIVVPNVMGIAVWSPRLDEMGNSVRGVDFCKEFIKTFNFHNYDSLVGQSHKKDPRINRKVAHLNQTFALISAASYGDLDEIKRLFVQNIDLNLSDYDGRTALHLAAIEGHLNIVEYLLNKGADISPKDRFGRTPLDDALSSNHQEVVDLLSTFSERV